MNDINSFSINEPDFVSSTTIDFDEGNLPGGTAIADQFEGLSISTSEKFGVMIFDTNNPTGGDRDLGAGIGNALIISEDGDSSDPDDNAAGGTISINFEQLTTVTRLGLLDIEELGGSVRLFDEQSHLIEVREIAPTGNGHLQDLDLNVPGVSRMDIHLAGSGALTELNFFQEEALITPTQLTDIGWEKNGQLLGIWTNGNDIVRDLVAGIEVASTVTANTLQGDDLIYGQVSSGNGLLYQGTIITEQGDDTIKGEVEGTGNSNIGIVGNGSINSIIDMGSGNDEMIGVVDVEGSGNDNRGIEIGDPFVEIDMGSGNDQIDLTVTVEGSGNNNDGIEGISGDIDMGSGNDRIDLTVTVGESGNVNSGIDVGEVIISTGDGDDQIDVTVTVGESRIGGSGDRNNGVSIGDASIETGDGNDLIDVTVAVEGSGSFNSGIEVGAASNLNMGSGNDQIDSIVTVGGSGDENTGITTIVFGNIDVGNGDDEITGIVGIEGSGNNNFGILNEEDSIIDMGNGDDEITGIVGIERSGNNNFGIVNDQSSIIDMGAGDDKITGIGADAFTGFGGGRFGGFGKIDLGEGNDNIIGFGQQIVDGAGGMDTAKFEFNLDESITLSSNDINSIDITANQVTMSFTNMEEFVFANGSFTLDDLLNTLV